MFNSTTLEVAIGMALIYLLLSLFCTAINEAIAGILSSRAKNLEKGIRSLFTDGLKTEATANVPAVTLANAIYDHGLVQSLYRSTAEEKQFMWGKRFGTNLPSYIPSRVFATALFDVLFPAGVSATSGSPTSVDSTGQLAAMMSSLKALPDGKGKQAIMTLVRQAEGDITKTRQAFEDWYNDAMDRVAGWYKRKTQVVLFVLGLIIAIGLNVDSVAVGRALWISPALRSYAITAAEQYVKNNSTTPLSEDATKDLSVLQSLDLPLGWNSSKLPWIEEHGTGASYSRSFSKMSLLFVICGWLLTAIAMTLGAPFWFDTLNHFMVARSTIKPQDPSGTDGSKK
jgi:hypothetical protein